MTTRRALLTGLAGLAGAALTGAGSAWAGTRQPPAELAPPGRDDLKVRIRTRAEWGADESLRFDAQGAELWPPTFSPVQCLTVHHSAIAVDGDRDAAVRSIYQGHTVGNKWGDIGYHLVIDPEGVLYQGRHTGGPAVFGRGGTNGVVQSVTAGHVRGRNPGNVGICLLGDFTGGQPNPLTWMTLSRTLAALCLLCKLPDPMGRLTYRNVEDGQTYEGPVLGRHRDWVSTQCPGNAFADSFEPVRQEVARLLRGPHRKG